MSFGVFCSVAKSRLAFILGLLRMTSIFGFVPSMSGLLESSFRSGLSLKMLVRVDEAFLVLAGLVAGTFRAVRAILRTP